MASPGSLRCQLSMFHTQRQQIKRTHVFTSLMFSFIFPVMRNSISSRPCVFSSRAMERTAGIVLGIIFIRDAGFLTSDTSVFWATIIVCILLLAKESLSGHLRGRTVCWHLACYHLPHLPHHQPCERNVLEISREILTNLHPGY